MDILDRVKMIMKMNQMNAAAFADRIGVRRSNVSHVLTGRNKPSLDFIEKILIQFPKVNASWLISGNIQEETEGIYAAPESFPVTNGDNTVRNKIINVNLEENTNVSSGKKVVKIITFYEDFTFDEFRPNHA